MTDHYEGVLLEDINDKLDRLAEAMGSVRDDVQRLTVSVAPIPAMQKDIVTIKAVLKEHSAILNDHTATLKEHSLILNGHSNVLETHTKNLRIIKNRVRLLEKAA